MPDERSIRPGPPPEAKKTAAFPHALKRRLACVAGLLLLLVVLLFAAGPWCLRFVPLPAGLESSPPAGLLITDRHGTPLRTARSRAGSYARPVDYREIPQALVQATLAAEDGRFWEHNGVDWRATARAAWHLVQHQRVISGGSTISQQLIKLAQPRPRTFPTKLIEAAQALRLEQVWGKQRILLQYLNRLDYGNLITGCAPAAEFYLSKPLTNLSVAECAFLAGLPQAPSRLNPLHHLDRAKRRQEWILNRMLALGFLTRVEMERALGERTIVSGDRSFEAPHFVDLLLAQREEQPAEPHAQFSSQVRTTLDLELNRFAETSLRNQLKQLSALNVRNGAAVIIDNASGGILALVGSEDFFSPKAGQVNGAWAPRAAGSTFKPFTYLLALEQGASPATIVADIPADFPSTTGLFSPLNYDRRCYGPVRYRTALANSLNIAAVKVLDAAGGAAVLQRRLQLCGLTTLSSPPDHYGLGLTIGNAEARLLELANAYSCLARLGSFIPSTMLLDRGGKPATPTQVCDPVASFLIADMLSDNAARAMAFGLRSSLSFGFPVACKTGTSSAFRDNWAFAYTPEFTVGVWVGNFDGSPMSGVSGVTGAAPVMHELMQHLRDRFGTSWYQAPATLVRARVHAITAKRLPPGMNHPDGQPPNFICEDYFRRDQLPPIESPGDYDSRGRILLPAEYRDWLNTGDNWLAGQAVASDSTEESDLRILFPPPGTILYLDPDLPEGGRKLRLRTTGQGVVWSSDTLACAIDPVGSFAMLQPGRHHLKAADPASGLVRDTWVEVLRP